MRFLRRLSGFLGIQRGEPHGANNGGDEDDEERTAKSAPRGPTERFGVAVERPNIGPIFVPCSLGEGGVQGFRWYVTRLRMDDDGDVADEFLAEKYISGTREYKTAPPRFEVKYTTRRPTVRQHIIAVDGNIHQSMEYKGSCSRYDI